MGQELTRFHSQLWAGSWPAHQESSDRRPVVNMVNDSLDTGENVMLDPDGMSPARLAELQQVVAENPEWLGKGTVGLMTTTYGHSRADVRLARRPGRAPDAERPTNGRLSHEMLPS